MKHIKIKQTDIKDNDGYFFYEDVFIRILESEIEFQQGRDVVMISKLKLKEILNWMHYNGCEMAFIDINTTDSSTTVSAGKKLKETNDQQRTSAAFCQCSVSGRSEQLRGEMLEQKAKEALQEIHKHTTLCCDDDEEHIFICGYNAGYNDQKNS